MIDRTEQEIMKSWKGDINQPIVSVCTITYNHEKYIAQAIESFLMQETDFPFEIVIDDDFSTDNNALVIKEYAQRYPTIIKANLREKNVGMMPNFIENMQRAKGKYIALCEGDDYWTDPLKLQIQVDFLENNSDYVACYSSATVINDNGVVLEQNKNFGDSDQDELIAGSGHAITGSVMFRKFDFNEYSHYNIINGDTLLWHFFGFYGKCKYLKNIKNTVYRVHPAGAWSGRSESSRLIESLKTKSVIRERIISKVKNHTHVLKKHDTYYPYVFAVFFYKNMARLEIKGCMFGLEELNKLKFIKKSTVFYALMKHILWNVTVLVKLKSK